MNSKRSTSLLNNPILILKQRTTNQGIVHCLLPPPPQPLAPVAAIATATVLSTATVSPYFFQFWLCKSRSAYLLDALEPHMSHETFEYHWEKHHRAYVDHLNKQIARTELDGITLEGVVFVTYNKGDLRPPFNNAAQCSSFYTLTSLESRFRLGINETRLAEHSHTRPKAPLCTKVGLKDL
ncbi:Superoxide dismutase [Forsythia ovata]|uniref:superoxide dismutase n=1 Tax=Forsythia ovata TaxID=205694 RepID=A0ABD1UXK6_9LAMI